MSIWYDLPRGQFFDEEDRYVNPATVAEKLRQAEAEARKWEWVAREMSKYDLDREFGSDSPVDVLLARYQPGGE